MNVGTKIDFKQPNSGRGRPASGTVEAIGDMITVVTRLGDKVDVDPTWVKGEHAGNYTRKAAEAAVEA